MAPEDAPFQRGVVFGLYARDDLDHVRRGLAEIRALGANAVSIHVPWVIPDVRSTTMAPRPDMTPQDASLRRAIRLAHATGMDVFVLPLIYVDAMEEGEWRGTLAPADWSAWFAAYRAFLMHYAVLSEEEHVAILAVGSELCSTESRGGEWGRLIEEVRRVYSGALTYSANWDHRGDLPFAGRLDYLGTNAYFELSDDPDAPVEALVSAWNEIVPEVLGWASRAGKPLILTEVGYPSRRGSARDPWDSTSREPPDPAAQGRAYRAFVEAWTGHPGLRGVYFYLWWGEGGAGDAGYTPRGKPAEKVLADWFGGGARGVRP
jgi:hypothetical protein